MRRVVSLFACAVVLGSCTSSTPDSSSAEPERPKEVTFPAAFAFGSATAGMQIEKGLTNTNWGIWATMDGKVRGGDLPDDGPDSLAHVQEDVDLMKSMGLTAYRFSIELARVYPTREAFDSDTPNADGIAAYDALFDALAQAGIRPMVTLQHFTWPDWMEDPRETSKPQGWARSESVDVFAEWARRAATRWGARVDDWVTINEPFVAPPLGHLAGLWPPGVSDVEQLADALRNEVYAHAKGYDAIKGADTVDATGDGEAARISIAKHNRVYVPADPDDEDDVADTKHAEYFWNLWFLNAVVKGDFDHDFDGSLDGPNDTKADPALKGRLDWVGVNYYGLSRVSRKSLRFKYMGPFPAQQDLPTERPKNDVGWDIYPEGLGKVLDQAATYGLPLMVTENGIADADGQNRVRFLNEHLFEIGWAIKRGVDVRGYMHWSLVHNFEWAFGFCPEFGLVGVDLANAAKTRKPTQAVDAYRQITSSRTITQASIDALPAYAPSKHKCSAF